MKKYVKYDNVEYFMPFLYCNDIFIPVLKELLKDEINPIKYVYGCIDCAWQGGRESWLKITSLSQIDYYLKCLKSQNLIPTFTFTNINKIEEKLNDETSNNLLDIAYKNDAHFIVASDALYNHIKSRYPEAKMHCSVINPICKQIDDKNFDETRFYNEMLDKYEIVVLRPEYTIENIDRLDKIISDISRVEVLINQYCRYNCQYHKLHYIVVNEVNYLKFNPTEKEKLGYEIEKMSNLSEDIDKYCPLRLDIDYKSVYMTDEQVEKLVNIGVKKLKLQGRQYNFDMIFYELYQHFFNKEISKEEIRNKVDLICAKMIQADRKKSIIFAMKGN